MEGERPDGADEIALGKRSAGRLGAEIGDRVTVSTVNGDRSAVVSGFVVMPPVGPFISNRAGLGTGLFLPGPCYAELLAAGVAVRTRRRELDLLRALGATGSQLRATLRWQALTIVGTGLVLGVPLGVALGRVTWRAFADDLGISTSPDIPPLWIGIVVAGGLVVALLVSALPGRVAARVSPAEVLRGE